MQENNLYWCQNTINFEKNGLTLKSTFKNSISNLSKMIPSMDIFWFIIDHCETSCEALLNAVSITKIVQFLQAWEQC